MSDPQPPTPNRDHELAAHETPLSPEGIAAGLGPHAQTLCPSQEAVAQALFEHERAAYAEVWEPTTTWQDYMPLAGAVRPLLRGRTEREFREELAVALEARAEQYAHTHRGADGQITEQAYQRAGGVLAAAKFIRGGS